MKVVRCKQCKAPISLRSPDLMDAFTKQACRLRDKYHGKLKRSSMESSRKQLCSDCHKGEKE